MTTSKYRIDRLAEQRPDQQSSYAKVTWTVCRNADNHKIVSCTTKREAQHALDALQASEQLDVIHANTRSKEI